MLIQILASDIVLAEEVRAHVRRRALFALSRLSDRVSRVVVRLSDVNGPRGGVDKRCSVQVHLRGAAPAIIEDKDLHLLAVVDRALGRAGRLVSKRLARGTQIQRSALPVPA